MTRQIFASLNQVTEIERHPGEILTCDKPKR